MFKKANPDPAQHNYQSGRHHAASAIGYRCLSYRVPSPESAARMLMANGIDSIDVFVENGEYPEVIRGINDFMTEVRDWVEHYRNSSFYPSERMEYTF